MSEKYYRCACCKREKTIEMFYVRKGGKPYSYCKLCLSKRKLTDSARSAQHRYRLNNIGKDFL